MPWIIAIVAVTCVTLLWARFRSSPRQIRQIVVATVYSNGHRLWLLLVTDGGECYRRPISKTDNLDPPLRYLGNVWARNSLDYFNDEPAQ